MIDKAEYEICQRRGHDSLLLTTNGKWGQCKWCGTWMRAVRTIEEREDEPPEENRSALDKFK